MANIFQDLKNTYQGGGLIQRLIFWIIGVFVIMMLLKVVSLSAYDFLLNWLSLSSNHLSVLYKPWTLVTYSFLHAGVIHLLLNVIMLYFVGQLFTTFFSQRQFLACYLSGAILGGIFYLVGSIFLNVGPILVGASAGVLATLVAIVTYSPYMQVRVLLFGQVKIWYIAAFIIILDIIQLSGSNIGGHLAHLGGAFMGFLYIKLYLYQKDFSVYLNKINGVFAKKQKPTFSKVYRNNKKTSASTFNTKSASDTQKQIDAILDKISKSGYDSLTKQEKDFLFTAGKK